MRLAPSREIIMPRISHSHESYQSKPPRSKWGTVLARYDRTGALIAWQVRAYRNFCGAYNRGPALWEQACRPVIFVAWKMMRPRWWAGWRENAIQQSEEMPRVRACDEEERADRQGRPAVEMPGLPVELDDAAAAAQAGADCFASMFVRQVRQCFSAVWADGFPRCRHRFPVM